LVVDFGVSPKSVRERQFGGTPNWATGTVALLFSMSNSSFYSLYYDEEWLPLLDKGKKPRGEAELIRRLKKQVGRSRLETVVDVGCGNGGHTSELAEAFPKAQIAGVDPYVPGLEEAVESRSKEEEDRIFFLQGTLEALPFEDESTDLLWCFDTFCHVRNPEVALRECARVLVPGGLFALTSPFCTADMDTVTWRQLQPIGISRQAMDAEAVAGCFPRLLRMMASLKSGEILRVCVRAPRTRLQPKAVTRMHLC